MGGGSGSDAGYANGNNNGGGHNYGWIGLIGLAGLAGLRRGNRTDTTVRRP
jgi:MYXO-CTERM domain-containing protein